jgi:hypothetical protein
MKKKKLHHRRGRTEKEMWILLTQVQGSLYCTVIFLQPLSYFLLSFLLYFSSLEGQESVSISIRSQNSHVNREVTDDVHKGSRQGKMMWVT